MRVSVCYLFNRCNGTLEPALVLELALQLHRLQPHLALVRSHQLPPPQPQQQQSHELRSWQPQSPPQQPDQQQQQPQPGPPGGMEADQADCLAAGKQQGQLLEQAAYLAMHGGRAKRQGEGQVNCLGLGAEWPKAAQGVSVRSISG